MKHSTIKLASPVLVIAVVGTVIWVNAGELDPPAATMGVTAEPDGSPSLLPLLDGNSRKLSFQARLTDGQGDPLSGMHTLRFKIYDDPVLPGPLAGGGPFDVGVDIDPQDDGVVAVLLPDGDGVGLDGSLFTGQARYLGVEINPPAAELSPRILLAGVPHAMRVDFVGNEELTDDVVLGDSGTSGSLTAYDAASASPAITLDGSSNQITIFGNDGNEHVALWGFNSGQLLLTDDDGDMTAGVRAATVGGTGANLFLSNEQGSFRFFAEAATTGGALTLYDGTSSPTLSLTGESGIAQAEFAFQVVDAISPSPTVLARLQKHSQGAWLWINDENGDTTARLGSSNNPGVGGFAEFYRGTGGASVFIDGDDGSGGGLVTVENGADAPTITLDGSGHRLTTYGSDGLEQIRLWGPSFGEILLYNSSVSNDRTVMLSATGGSGGELRVFRNDGGIDGVLLSGGTTSGGAGFFFNSSAAPTIELDGDEGDGGALFTMSDGFQTTIDLDANAGGGGAGIILSNSAHVDTLILDADSSDDAKIQIKAAPALAQNAIILDSNASGGGSQISLYDKTGLSETVEIRGQEGAAGGQILIRNDDFLSNTTTIELDGNYNGTGEGRVITDVLEIKGGSDLSERFDIHAPRGTVEPGMIVCIDVEQPGRLVVSQNAYDRTVAGIVSGAGGVKPGMLMGQSGTEADGQYPVALSGRVYCRVDASNGPIQPGDLLTTSATSGHAMKVTDYDRAQGAIIGKAMSKATDGLVLVLVSLQ
ncbi:MAG: hypothetical protein V3W34_14600 [Phycisphaerae bacterium]